MNREEFINSKNWNGSYYELAMEYVPTGNDERLLKAITALWESPTLSGPWQTQEQFGQTGIVPSTLEADGYNWLYGIFGLADDREVGCMSLTVREEGGSDWLDLCLPTGMLRQVYPLRYSIDATTRRDNPWLDSIDERMIAIAEHIYSVAPFDFAMLGEEVSGMLHVETLTADQLSNGGMLLPPKLSHKLGIVNPRQLHVSGLHWLPWQIE